jgi:hypothetical protein
MPLQYKVETLDNIDEALRGLYAEDEAGGFRLVVEGLDDAAELKRAKDHEKARRKEVERQLKELQDAKTAEAEKARKAHEDALSKAGDVDALIKSWEKKHADGLAAKDAEYQPRLTKLESTIRRVFVSEKAQAIANEIAVSGSASVLVDHIAKRLRAEDRDGDYVTIVVDAEGKASALTLDDLKKEFVGNKAFAPVIAGSKGSGSGAGGAKGGGAAVGTQKRSQMSVKEKAAYVDEHGKDAFFALPE